MYEYINTINVIPFTVQAVSYIVALKKPPEELPDYDQLLAAPELKDEIRDRLLKMFFSQMPKR